MALIHRYAAMRPGDVTTLGAPCKQRHASTPCGRSPAAGSRRTPKSRTTQAVLNHLTGRWLEPAGLIAPQLVGAVRLGSDTASDLLVAAGDNPGGIHQISMAIPIAARTPAIGAIRV